MRIVDIGRRPVPIPHRVFQRRTFRQINLVIGIDNLAARGASRRQVHVHAARQNHVRGRNGKFPIPAAQTHCDGRTVNAGKTGDHGIFVRVGVADADACALEQFGCAKLHAVFNADKADKAVAVGLQESVGH